jgi:hypothetical protein
VKILDYKNNQFGINFTDVIHEFNKHLNNRDDSFGDHIVKPSELSKSYNNSVNRQMPVPYLVIDETDVTDASVHSVCMSSTTNETVENSQKNNIENFSNVVRELLVNMGISEDKAHNLIQILIGFISALKN